MIQTSQSEYEALYASALPGFLEYVKSHGTPVAAIETALSLDGITSLPARMLLGGVEKNVLVPITLLCKDVDTYIEEAKSTTVDAKAATADALAASKSVTYAITNISEEKKAALSAATTANVAADKAYEKIEQLEDLMTEVAQANAITPTIMHVSYLDSISTKNKVAKKINAQLIPTYVGQNVLFVRDEGTSLKCNPSGELTVMGIGETVFHVIPTQNTQLWQTVTINVRQPRLRLTSTGKLRLNGTRIRIL